MCFRSSLLQMLFTRFGQLALLSNTSITFLCLLAGLTLVTTSDSMNPDLWKPVRDKLEHNFDITYTCEIGRASCRERVCQYVEISVVAGSLKTQQKNKLITSSCIRVNKRSYN